MIPTPSKQVRSEAKEPGQKTKPSRGFKLSGDGKENLAGYLFLLPWFAGLLLLTAGPMLSSLYLSFTKFDLLSAPQWIGIQNYQTMFQDPRWLTSVKVTLMNTDARFSKRSLALI